MPQINARPTHFVTAPKPGKGRGSTEFAEVAQAAIERCRRVEMTGWKRWKPVPRVHPLVQLYMTPESQKSSLPSPDFARKLSPALVNSHGHQPHRNPKRQREYGQQNLFLAVATGSDSPKTHKPQLNRLEQPMKAIVHPSVMLALICLFSVSMVTNLNGQDQVEKSKKTTRMAGKKTMPKFDIDFEGGTVAAYVTMLKDIATARTSGPVNVILDENIQDLKLPAISVSEVPLEAAINVLERIRLDDGRINVSSSKSIYVITGERWKQPTENQQAGIQNSQKAQQKNKPETNVFSVREILTATEEKDLLSALEIGLKLSDEATPVEMKLHSETGLLFAKGSKSQIRMIYEVVDNLSRTARDAKREKQQRMMLEMQRNQQQKRNKKSSSK